MIFWAAFWAPSRLYILSVIRSFGQPRETTPTLGVDFAVVVEDMSNLGIALDQLYVGKYDECCAG